MTLFLGTGLTLFLSFTDEEIAPGGEFGGEGGTQQTARELGPIPHSE